MQHAGGLTLFLRLISSDYFRLITPKLSPVSQNLGFVGCCCGSNVLDLKVVIHHIPLFLARYSLPDQGIGLKLAWTG